MAPTRPDRTRQSIELLYATLRCREVFTIDLFQEAYAAFRKTGKMKDEGKSCIDCILFSDKPIGKISALVCKAKGFFSHSLRRKWVFRFHIKSSSKIEIESDDVTLSACSYLLSEKVSS